MSRRKQQLHGKRTAHHQVPFTLRATRFLFARAGALFPRLLGRWAFRLWFRTRRFPESAAGKLATRESQREILTVDKIPVVIYRWGAAGPLVLFIHGWSGRGSQVAGFLEPLLAAGFRVISVDAPGHGDTPGERTNILECNAVLQAIDAEYGPIHGAITHSFGGMVLAYAMNHGLAIGRAVVISAPSDVEFLLERFAETLSMHPAVLDDLERRMELRFDHDFWERVSTVDNVKELQVPALVVHDEQDASVPWTQGQRIAASWPNARFLKTSGLGHGRILRDAGVIAAVVQFIAQD